jgi:lipopolysaccharide export system permease protein
MMRIPTTFSFYIARHFLLGVGVVLAILTAIIVLFDALEILRRAHSRNVPFAIILEMLLMKFPSRIQEVLPFTVLLGGILSFGRLTRSSELIVARAAGVSVWQFLAPAIITSFIAGVFLVTVFNPMAATMVSRFEQLEAKYLRGGSSMLSISESGLWLRQQNEFNEGKTILHASSFSSETMELFDVTFFIFGESNSFERRIDAEEAKLTQQSWEVKKALITTPGEAAVKKDFFNLETNLSTEQIQESFAPPETISFWELPGFIRMLKEAGFSALRHSLYWHNVLVIPFFLSAMVFFAAAFSLRPPRYGKTGALMAGGVFVGFLIRFLSDLVSAVSLSGSIPVALAAWAPIGIIVFVGTALLLHLEDG